MIKKWMKAAGIRAIKTFGQTAASFFVVGSAMGDVDWWLVLSTALVAMIFSILTSLGGLPEVDSRAKIELDEENDCYIDTGDVDETPKDVDDE